MVVTNLISTNIPQLQLEDKVSKALSLLDDFGLHHLCVVQKEKFLGIVNKEDLLSINESATIQALQEDFVHYIVNEQEHFSKALTLMAENNLSLLPVLNAEKDYVGVIVAEQLLYQMATFIGAADQGGIVIVEMERRNYSFSEITRLVETHDAVITQLNTQTNNETGFITVTIKLNKTEISDIIATLQRFDYNIIAYFGEEAFANELQENYNHLLHYLKI